MRRQLKDTLNYDVPEMELVVGGAIVNPRNFILKIGSSINSNVSGASEHLTLYLTDNYDFLGMEYFYNHSGDKFLSPMLERLFDKTSNKWDANIYTGLNSTILEYVTDIIANHYGLKWSQIYEALIKEYNPLENYNMKETRTPDLTHETVYDTETNSSDSMTREKSDNLSDSKSSSGSTSKSLNVEDSKSTTNSEEKTVNYEDSKSGSGSETTSKELNEDESITKSGEKSSSKSGSEQYTKDIDTEENVESSSSNGVYGFNSVVAVPSEEGEASSKGTRKGTFEDFDGTTGETVNEDVEESTSGLKTTSGSDSTTKSEEETLTREGTEGTESSMSETTSHNEEESNSVSSSDTVTHEGSEEESMSNTGSSSKTGKDVTTETGTEDLERSGNIGVTTSQQMLEQEFRVRQYDFVQMMFEDIDKIMCLCVY